MANAAVRHPRLLRRPRAHSLEPASGVARRTALAGQALERRGHRAGRHRALGGLRHPAGRRGRALLMVGQRQWTGRSPRRSCSYLSGSLMKQNAFVVLSLLLSAVTLAAPPQGFEQRAEAARKQIGAPGMAIAIVENGQV